MTSVGIRELKARLSGYVERVRRGEEIAVTDRGKEVALIVPISRERRAVNCLMQAGRATWTGDKPRGVKGIKGKGAPVSDTVLEGRR